jgi:hypothetical protein
VCLKVGTSSCKHGKEVSDSNWQEEKEVTEEIKEVKKSNKRTAPTQHQHLHNRQKLEPTTILPSLHQK